VAVYAHFIPTQFGTQTAKPMLSWAGQCGSGSNSYSVICGLCNDTYHQLKPQKLYACFYFRELKCRSNKSVSRLLAALSKVGCIH